MANKSPEKNVETVQTSDPFNAFEHLQDAGLGNLMGLGTAWAEAIGDMGAEVAQFVAERIQEDVKTQHEILHCKNVSDLQNIQAQFVQKAMEQYQAETGKLIKMGMESFADAASGKPD